MASSSAHERPTNAAYLGQTSNGISNDEEQQDVEAGTHSSSVSYQVSGTETPNASGLGTELPLQDSDTELHKAVRQRDNDEVYRLRENPSLAQKPDSNNMPPLYLAVHLGYEDIADNLIKNFGDSLSYDGPFGQTVLHIAALRSKDLTEKVLEKCGDLTNKPDKSGTNKPLHFAASVGVDGVTSLLLKNDYNDVKKQKDNNGMCPIHIAASFGAMDAICALVGGNDNSSVALRDTNGRTFLHVAIEKRRTNVVEYVCRTSRFKSILNLKNKDGNTALHLAVLKRDESIFSHLVGNRLVELNHVNDEGYTALDLASIIKGQQSYASRQNPTEWMIRTLAHSGGHFSARMRGSTPGAMQNHQVDLARSTESVLVASALIATVTFAAAFTMPGSYKTEGHPKAGTPALGGHYGFKVFLVANILAFFCSVAATYSLAEYGSRGDPLVRCIYAQRAIRFFHVALKSVIIAFTLGVSVVMWDISVITTIIVIIAASGLVLYGNEALAHDFKLMRVMYRRFGLSLSWTLYPSTSSHLDWNTWRLRSFSATLAWNTIKLFSTYIFIFVVAYIAQLKQKGGN